jgi:aspartyl-tRNA(Asn)/glutamyl-tRNA(Gln) amidotransferase subunit A
VDPCDLSLTDLAARIASGEVSSSDAVAASLSRIEAIDDLNAFTQVFGAEAAEAARAIDDRIASEGASAVGPLAGVPVAIKDNICTTLGRTTCGSRMLRRYVSPFDATCVERLLAAGAVIVGKTNLDEFAMGSSNEHSAFGPAGNPWAADRSPGGSSGGSAAAVGAGAVPLALGSDTGGSIRQPAALCGAVGYKPTYGLVSRFGLVAFASSLDQIGPITRTVADAALAARVIIGPDDRDSTCVSRPAPDLTLPGSNSLSGVRFGVPTQLLEMLEDADVAAAFDRARAIATEHGAEIVDVDLPSLEYGIAAYYIIAPAEASSNLARYDGVRYGHRAEAIEGESLEDLYSRTRAEGFGPEVQRRIMLGTHALSSGYYDAYYLTALKARRRIKDDFDRALETCDAVLTPATPEPPFRLGAKTDDPLALYLQDIFTVSANLSGGPGVAIPAGTCQRENTTLPIGIQLLGRAFDDANLLRHAAAMEAALDFTARPPLAGSSQQA